MVSMFTSVRSDSAPMVSRGFVFMLWLISVVAPGSEPSDDLYSMLDQFAVAGTDGTFLGHQPSPNAGGPGSGCHRLPAGRCTGVAALNCGSASNVAFSAPMARLAALRQRRSRLEGENGIGSIAME